jgi:hypothetical protein
MPCLGKRMALHEDSCLYRVVSAVLSHGHSIVIQIFELICLAELGKEMLYDTPVEPKGDI